MQPTRPAGGVDVSRYPALTRIFNGGPGSGRYPKGSSGSSGASDAGRDDQRNAAIDKAHAGYKALVAQGAAKSDEAVKASIKAIKDNTKEAHMEAFNLAAQAGSLHRSAMNEMRKDAARVYADDFQKSYLEHLDSMRHFNDMADSHQEAIAKLNRNESIAATGKSYYDQSHPEDLDDTPAYWKTLEDEMAIKPPPPRLKPAPEYRPRRSEADSLYAELRKLKNGGPGSGRYPKGSGGENVSVEESLAHAQSGQWVPASVLKDAAITNPSLKASLESAVAKAGEGGLVKGHYNGPYLSFVARTAEDNDAAMDAAHAHQDAAKALDDQTPAAKEAKDAHSASAKAFSTGNPRQHAYAAKLHRKTAEAYHAMGLAGPATMHESVAKGHKEHKFALLENETEASDDLIINGGAGSGNFGHSGRPGERGGSQPAATGVVPDRAQARARQQFIHQKLREAYVAKYGKQPNTVNDAKLKKAAAGAQWEEVHRGRRAGIPEIKTRIHTIAPPNQPAPRQGPQPVAELRREREAIEARIKAAKPQFVPPPPAKTTGIKSLPPQEVKVSGPKSSEAIIPAAGGVRYPGAAGNPPVATPVNPNTMPQPSQLRWEDVPSSKRLAQHNLNRDEADALINIWSKNQAIDATRKEFGHGMSGASAVDVQGDGRVKESRALWAERPEQHKTGEDGMFWKPPGELRSYGEAGKEFAVAAGDISIALKLNASPPAAVFAKPGGNEVLRVGFVNGTKITEANRKLGSGWVGRISKDSWERVATLDYLIGMGDGHGGNYHITPDNKVVNIDSNIAGFSKLASHNVSIPCQVLGKMQADNKTLKVAVSQPVQDDLKKGLENLKFSATVPKGLQDALRQRIEKVAKDGYFMVRAPRWWDGAAQEARKQLGIK